MRILNKIFSTGIYNFQYVFQLRKLYALNSEFERKLDSNDARCVKMIDIGELSFGVNKGFSQSPKFIIPAKFNNIWIWFPSRIRDRRRLLFSESFLIIKRYR